ncbi:unnamed protein product, partial [Medioppia subpectinata]
MYEREEREGANRRVLWRPEYGEFQIEATPGQPYGHQNELNDDNIWHNLFNTVEENMKSRRREIRELLDHDEAIICITNFPRLGNEDISVPYCRADPANSTTGSIFASDELTCIFHPRLGNEDISVPYCRADPANSTTGSIFASDELTCIFHPRYLRTSYNVVQRRGRKVSINVPIFKDTKTPDPFVEIFNDKESKRAAKVDHIYLDSGVFGMGCCCLQVTLQATNIDEAMVLNDQMAQLAPIMMALSAGGPIYRGYLSDRDCRWDVISNGVDDRTREELGEKPLKNEKFRIHKSRYAPINTYLCECNAKYNDNPIVYNTEFYNEMISAGVTPSLAQHMAYVFIRDPTITYREKLDQNDSTETDHFENIQSTNWQTMRFKPPPLNQQSIGWRVEFRPMEIQMTDFENAAFSVFT